MSILSTAFDALAAPYERMRPGYPPALIERVLDFARLSPGARLLEIGTGTGKATEPFARRGFRVLGLEPGANLVNVARQRLAAFPEVSIEQTTFEDWPLEAGAFQLVFAAQSLHWVAVAERLSKSARALAPGGTLAVFGHAPDISADPAFDAIQRVYRRQAPSLAGRDGARHFYRSQASPMLAELQASSDFQDIHHESFRWQRTLTAAAYCELLCTYSDHATLPAAMRSKLLTAVARAIDAHGGSLTIEYHTGLFLARCS
jgi:SAM-dependent methyltransferase